MRKSQPKGQQKRREVTEEKLISAAVALFSKFGFDGTTTKALSKKSGVNESLIIRYFGGKKGLYLELIKRFIAREGSQPLPYPLQKNLEEEIVCHVKHMLESIGRNLDYFKILFGRSTLTVELKKRVSDIVPKTGDPRIRERIENLRDQGKVPKDISTDLLLLIPTQVFCMIYLVTTSLDQSNQVLSEPLEKLVRATVRGLLQ